MRNTDYCTHVFPAPAGINRKPRPGDRRAGCVPRASGDKPGALDAMMDIT
ncbi:hypothetical protein FXI30_000196 [Escherichia coli]|nr:hypothetical protein [Escherichia coli]EHH5100556.1 hypothetical protein [Escherichia coli]HAV9750095.1 hypothetical protein [Escherichia coli]